MQFCANLCIWLQSDDGHYLQISPKCGRSWVLRIKVGALRRDIGLGGFPTVTPSQARDKIERSIDTLEERNATKAARIAAQRRALAPYAKPR